MAKYTTKVVTTKAVWEKFVLASKPGTFLQSWNWGEVNEEIGYRIVRLGFYEDSKLVGVACLIHQPAKRGPHFLIPGGPVIDYTNPRLLKFVLAVIKTEAKKWGVWFVRIRPDIQATNQLKAVLEKHALISSPMHVHGENSLVLDLTQASETLLKKMRKTTRYLIKKGLSEGYQVERSTDPEKTKVLFELQKETVKRHKFVGFKKNLFDKEIDIFGQDDQAALYTCHKGNLALMSAIVVYYAGKAFYHFSGSAEAARHTNASYFLQWKMILDAQKLGCKQYDFWGIAPTDDPRHRFYGVTIFKKGFGGERVDWLHAHDIVISPLYFLTLVFETIRKKSRRL